MKQVAATIISLLLICSCEDDNLQAPASFPRAYELPNGPEGSPLYDFSNYGIYKGVVINSQDSSASFKIDLYNAGMQAYALCYRNGVLRDSLIRYKKDGSGLLAYPQKADTAGIPLNAAFYSCYFSSYRTGYGPIVGFNTSALGISYNMETVLNGNQTLNAVLKEKSGNQVHCFEGSYSGQDSGRVAFVISSDSVVGIRASVWNPQFFKLMTSKVINNNFTINQFDDVSGNTFIFTGSIENDKCFGSWIKSSSPGVVNNFTARRRL